MDPSTTIVVAVITALATVTVGYFTLRATVKAAAAKEKTDENAAVIAGWREMVQPLRDEVDRLNDLILKERVDHSTELAAKDAEHAAVLGALQPLNDEIDKRRKKP